MKIQGTPSLTPIESTSPAARSHGGTTDRSGATPQASSRVQLSHGTQAFLEGLQQEAANHNGIRSDVVAEMREAVQSGDLIARTDIHKVIDSLLADL